MKEILLISLLSIIQIIQCESGILYSKSSKCRELYSLDGLWDFSLYKGNISKWSDDKEQLFDFREEDEDVEIMPVPASYNDISTNSEIRDYVGVVRYQRNFILPNSWEKKRVWLRFGSVCYSAKVYINGKFAMSHEIGHLPFVKDITTLLNFENYNNITVLVNNILSYKSIPQGYLKTLSSGRIEQRYTFDFFNYAGIDRPVVLYTTDQTYIDDITITTKINGKAGIVYYNISVEGNGIFSHKTAILDNKGEEITSDQDTLIGSLQIPDVKLWWPYLMSSEPGYLYTLRVEIFDNSNDLLDEYDQPFGVRELTWDNTTFKINGKPLYLRGFGRHEDSDIRGKGLDLPLVIRDHNLIKWIGANSYRTSHYPYAEEIMDLADKLGIMIIDEVPAVNTEKFKPALLVNHKESITQLIRRDKNRPSVIMWSAANEPRTQYNESEEYYSEVIAHLKSLDTSRPVTVVNNINSTQDHSGQFVDILSFNKYSAWYDNSGDLDVIASELTKLADAWHAKHNKPVLVTEYGADTMEGLHFLPSYVWSEEYQTDLMSRHFEVFDQLRETGWFIGEMIWNFADFKTAQTFKRVGGNKKGIFTRQRQPKASAHLLRKRYWALAELLDNTTKPSDLNNYIINRTAYMKDEL